MKYDELWNPLWSVHYDDGTVYHYATKEAAEGQRSVWCAQNPNRWAMLTRTEVLGAMRGTK